MAKPGTKPDVVAGPDPPTAERFVHHRPDDHETKAIHHDDHFIQHDYDHDHDRPVNERSRLNAVKPACSATVAGPAGAARRRAQWRTVLDRLGIVILDRQR